MIKIAAFYKFVPLPDCESMREPLLARCHELGIKGTILLAHEGINSTLAGEPDHLDTLIDDLTDSPRFSDLDIKYAYADEMPFKRMKVRIKKEIVQLGLPEVNPNEQVGQYVEPQLWNDLIAEPDVLVIDTRNDYEYEFGTFKGALNPKTGAFKQFPQYVQQALDPSQHKKVAMFCTGGIRCEKATAYMLQQGFEEVYHLKGGILNYLEKVAPDQSLWEGECFVFDEREAVDHHLQRGQLHYCKTCSFPIVEDECVCLNCGTVT